MEYKHKIFDAIIKQINDNCDTTVEMLFQPAIWEHEVDMFSFRVNEQWTAPFTEAQALSVLSVIMSITETKFTLNTN